MTEDAGKLGWSCGGGPPKEYDSTLGCAISVCLLEQPMNWTLKDEESSKEEGWDVHGRLSLSPTTFHPWGCKMKTENTLCCSSQGTESRPGRNYREREFCPKGGRTNYQGWPWTWGTLKTTRECACCLWGTASVLAWGLGSVGWAWNGRSSIQLPSNSGILNIFQALYRVARKKNDFSLVGAYLPS